MSQHPIADNILRQLLAGFAQPEGIASSGFETRPEFAQSVLQGQPVAQGTPDQGPLRSAVGDTPGALDDVGLDSSFLQTLLDLGSLMRFGMGSGQKFQETAQGNAPGFGEERISEFTTPGGEVVQGGLTRMPAAADIDQAQRSLSVASAANRFGPEIPALLSMLSIDNPAISNPESKDATLDALAAFQSGSFEPPVDPRSGLVDAIMGLNPIKATANVGRDFRTDLVESLVNKFGAPSQDDLVRDLIAQNQPQDGFTPVGEGNFRPIDELGGLVARMFGLQ